MVRTLRDRRTQAQEHRETPTVPTARPGIEPLPMLICSDLHVGEYVKDHARIEYVKKVKNLDRDFCAFIEYFGAHRRDDKPWRLVVNGDFIDFVAVTFVPSERDLAEHPDFEFLDEELQLGLDNTETKCVWKLEHIAKRHGYIFTYLADFVARGNHLDMLYGNHDVEFYWPRVQSRFVELLAEAFFGGERVEGVTEDDFQRRVQFHQWFLHVPGRIHIEHGNQYDDFSSFDHRLRPLMSFDPRQIAMPVSHLLIRYFVNQYSGFRSHDKDNWTLMDYVHWLRSQGLDNLIRIGFLYGTVFSRMWGYSRAIQNTLEPEGWPEEYDTLMEETAEAYGLTPEKVRAVHAERQRPIETSAGKTMQVSAIDKYLLGLFLASCVLSVLAWGFVADVLTGYEVGAPFSQGWRLLSLPLIGVLGVLLWPLLGKVMAGIAGGPLSTSVSPKLMHAAERLGKILDVPHVVMGHSHEPMQRQIQHNPPRDYTNLGSFLAMERRERHDPMCRSPLSFAVYDWTRDDIQLFRWCTRELEPVVFEASVESDDARHDERLRIMSPDHDMLVDALGSASGSSSKLFKRNATDGPASRRGRLRR